MGYALRCPNCGKLVNSEEHPDHEKITCPDCQTVYSQPTEAFTPSSVEARATARPQGVVAPPKPEPKVEAKPDTKLVDKPK